MDYLERSEKRNKLKSMPGWAVHWACSRLVSSIFIFKKNSEQLLAFLINPPLLEFQFLPDKETRLKKLESDNEAVRFIHNYVASANTLVDHFRRIKRKYLPNESQNKYEGLVKKDFGNARSYLILNLRNYILHVDIPSICSQVNITDSSSRLALLPEKLLIWKNWNAEVKIYLKSLRENKENILLDELVKEYSEKTINLSQWFLREIASCNHEELEEIYNSNDQILKDVKKNGLITDPLIVQFFTKNYRTTS